MSSSAEAMTVTHLSTVAELLSTIISNQQSAMESSRNPGTTEETGQSTSGVTLTSSSASTVVILNADALLTGYWRFATGGDWVPILPGKTTPPISVDSNANEVQVKSASALHKLYAIIYD